MRDSYTHDLAKLAKTAGLEQQIEKALDDYQLNWATVKDWNEESR